jgi:ribosomal protein uS5
VKAKKIKSLEEIFLFSIPVKEYQIVDYFIKEKMLDEVMQIMPVQKQTTAGQRTRFQAFVAVGDGDGHLGLGMKVGKEVADAIRGAIIAAKLAIAPIRRGYWGSRIGAPHTVPCKVSAKCGSVRVRLIPAPRGTGLVCAPASKKLLNMAGVQDCYSGTVGHSRTTGNFIKAIFYALRKTYQYLSPDLWEDKPLGESPFQVHSDFFTAKVKQLDSGKSEGRRERY